MRPLDRPARSGDPAELLVADFARLSAGDPRFARAARSAGHFPIRLRPAGFPTLLKTILAQQVSTAAAGAMWARLAAAIDPVTPRAFLALDDESLRACGFSRQKAGYGRGIAEALEDGRLDLEAVAAMADDAAIEALCALKGIGRRSAECYLLFALGRRDILPAKDLALQVGWQWLAGLADRPSPDALLDAAEPWRPRRSAAAFLIWGHYIATTEHRRRDRTIRI